MNVRSRAFAAWLPIGLLVACRAMAQPPAGPATDAVYDPSQLPSFEGKVQQFTLSPRGEIDGFILSDGTEVKTPPHLSTSIAYTIKPGSAVTIHGLRAAALPLLQAASVTDRATGRTIVDGGPQGGPQAPGRPGSAESVGTSEVSGVIRMELHGARGEVNGALMSDGTVLRLPPDETANIASLLQPGKPVVAQGVEVSNPLGKVVAVRAIGTSRAQLTPIDAPGPRDRERNKGPRPAG